MARSSTGPRPPTPHDLLLGLIDEAFDHRAWHGTTLRGSIRGMTADAAAWRPARDRHNVWEIVLHSAYWKYVVRRRLARLPRGQFALRGSDWFPMPDPPSDQAWRDAVRLLRDEHQRLRSTVQDVPVSALGQAAARGAFPNVSLIRGIAAHDLYHAGQIQLIKRLHAHGS